MFLLLKGMVVGLAISIPMGSVGVSVIHRVMTKEKQRAMMVGIGSIVADTIFGIIAVYGLSAISAMIADHRTSLGLVGGISLLYISINIFFSKPKDAEETRDIFSLSKDFATGFILTITNPLTAIAILALFAWFGINGAVVSIIPAIILILGLMAGLGLWWLTLISITTHFRERFQISSLKIINQIFGVLLFVLAILVLSRVI